MTFDEYLAAVSRYCENFSGVSSEELPDTVDQYSNWEDDIPPIDTALEILENAGW